MFRPGRYIDSKSAYVQSSKAKREREREGKGWREEKSTSGIRRIQSIP